MCAVADNSVRMTVLVVVMWVAIGAAGQPAAAQHSDAKPVSPAATPGVDKQKGILADQILAPKPTVLAERPTGPVTQCVSTECHGNLIDRAVLHGPVAQRRCDACHVVQSVKAHTYQLIVPKEELCSYCHTHSERNVVHEPVAKHECSKCHDPHGSDYKLQLVAEPTSALCFTCHEAKDYASSGKGHGSAEMQAIGACSVCHEAHSSWMPTLLPMEKKKLCIFCHEDTRKAAKAFPYTHKPLLEGDCLECHNAHQTGHPAQLRKAPPEACFACHDHDNVKEHLSQSLFVHGAMTDGDSCIACHAGHGSKRKNLLARPEINMCYDCHKDEQVTSDGRVVRDMDKLFDKRPIQHGPVQRGECQPCHQPHASDKLSLLRGEYPETFYAPYSIKLYSLCFECHMTGLVESEFGMGVTRFRDGDRNLHYVHVNMEKGRTCRVCHDVHAARKPHLIRDAVPFGNHGWEVEINHKQTESGGTCLSGCHEPRPYNRGPMEDFLFPPAALKQDVLAEWLRGENRTASAE